MVEVGELGDGVEGHDEASDLAQENWRGDDTGEEDIDDLMIWCLMNLEFSIFDFMGLKCFNFPMYSINTIYNLINIS